RVNYNRNKLVAFLSLPKELRFFLQKKKRPHVYPCVQMVGEDEESMFPLLIAVLALRSGAATDCCVSRVSGASLMFLPNATDSRLTRKHTAANQNTCRHITSV
ncbi:hypothetical protein KUCAC02_002797, partial [Chaenocephalus aceratus]